MAGAHVSTRRPSAPCSPHPGVMGCMGMRSRWRATLPRGGSHGSSAFLPHCAEGAAPGAASAPATAAAQRRGCRAGKRRSRRKEGGQLSAAAACAHSGSQLGRDFDAAVSVSASESESECIVSPAPIDLPRRLLTPPPPCPTRLLPSPLPAMGPPLLCALPHLLPPPPPLLPPSPHPWLRRWMMHGSGDSAANLSMIVQRPSFRNCHPRASPSLAPSPPRCRLHLPPLPLPLLLPPPPSTPRLQAWHGLWNLQPCCKMSSPTISDAEMFMQLSKYV